MAHFKEQNMAIWVKIRKLLQKNNIAYYEIYRQNYTTIECYMSVDKERKLIHFYLNDDFSLPIKVINCNQQTAPIGSIREISNLSYTKALVQGLKVLYSYEIFPDILDFEA